MHRELQRFGLIERGEALTLNALDAKTARTIAAIDRMNAPLLQALDQFLPPRSVAARRATRGRD